MNLNKFTKAELISKIKTLKNNPENQSKFWGYLFIIKSFLVKFTLLAFLIKFFKKYSIIRRIYVIINTVVMSIFGISMLDFYGLSFISAFIAELTSITGNIINYLSNTRFYSYLAGLLGHKVIPVKESSTKMGSMIGIDSSSTKLSKEVETNNRLSEWFNKQEEVKNDTPFYQNRYFIYGTIFVASCLTYYYFGDDIKVYGLTIWSWLRGRRNGDNPPDNPPVNRPIQSNNSNLMVNNQEINEGGSQSIFNPIVNFLGLNSNERNKEKIRKEWDDFMKSIEHLQGDEDAIEITSSTQKEFYPSDKGKGITKSTGLTSPSLDNLNAQAEDSWSKSRTSSPESITSTETIKPTKIKVTPNISNENSSSSSINVFKHDEIPKSMIEKTVEKLDEAFNEQGVIKPFIESPGKIKNLNDINWTEFVNKGIKDRMDYIENTWNNDHSFTNQEALKMSRELAIITESYDSLAYVYEKSKDNLTERKVRIVKEMSYYMRTWISNYSSKILTEGKKTINLNYKYDSPKNISKEIFGDD